jgi:hypothetical protein
MENKTVRYGKHCIAPGCTNWFYKTSCSEKHYHKLPLKDDNRLRQWLQNIKRKTAPINENANVCSDHFKDDDYETVGDFDESGAFCFKKTSTLKPTAVPTIFNFLSYNANATDIRSMPSTTVNESERDDRCAKRQKRLDAEQVK